MSDVVKVVGAIFGGTLLVFAIFALLFAIGVAFSTLVVAVVWNLLGLHAVFGLSALSFGQCVAVGAGLSVIGSLFTTRIRASA